MPQFSIPHDLVGHAALSLLPALAPLVRSSRLELSLRAVKAIDASGVALLVRLKSHLARVGGSLALTDPSASLALELRRIGLASLVLSPTEASIPRLVPAEASAR